MVRRGRGSASLTTALLTMVVMQFGNPEQANPAGERAGDIEDCAMWYVYILECDDKSLYVGMTGDMDTRFKQHLSGGARYTTLNKPEKILYQEEFDLKSQAESRESQIKRWTREKKLALAAGDFQRLKALSISND